MSERNNGMSSELQEIMRRRLEKSEVYLVENVEDEDDEISAITSKLSSSKLNASKMHDDDMKLNMDDDLNGKTNSDSRSSGTNFDGKETFDIRKNIAKFNKTVSPRPFIEETSKFARMLSPVSYMRFLKPTSISDGLKSIHRNTTENRGGSTVEPSASEAVDGIVSTLPTFEDNKMKFNQNSLSSIYSNQSQNGMVDANIPASCTEQTNEIEKEIAFSTTGDVLAQSMPSTNMDFIDSHGTISLSDGKDEIWNDQDQFRIPEERFGMPQDFQDTFHDTNKFGFGDDPFLNTAFPIENQLHNIEMERKMMNGSMSESISFGFNAFEESDTHETAHEYDSEIEILPDDESLLPPCINLSDDHIRSGLDLERGPAIITNNPIDDNIILCRKLDKCWILEEVGTRDSNLGETVMQHEISASIIHQLDVSQCIPELEGNLIVGVSDVLCIACCKIEERGHTGLRITAIVEILVLGQQKPITVGIVWKYGPMTHGNFELEFAYPSPQRSTSEVDFETFSVFIDENVLMLIVSSKDYNSAIHSMNFIDGNTWSTTVISETISVLHISLNPSSSLLALLTSHGNLTVWSYEGVKRGESNSVIERCEIQSSLLFHRDESFSDAKSMNISWLPFHAGYRAGYGLLSVSTDKGFSLFMIDLKVVNCYRELVNIRSLCSQETLSSKVTYLKCVESELPLLCVSFEMQNELLLYIYYLSLPSYSESNSDNSEEIRIREVLKKPIPLATHSKTSKLTLYRGGSTSSFVVYDSGHLHHHVPFIRALGDGTLLHIFPRMTPSISSFGLGLDSEGTPKDPDDVVLYIQKSIHFGNRSNWVEGISAPTYRFWLILSKVAEKNYVEAEKSNNNTDEHARTGATTRIVCEIKCIDSFTTPIHMHRSYDAKYCIVFFSKSDRPQPSFCNIIDVSQGTTVISLPGIDGTFINYGPNTSVLVLNEDGTISSYKLTALIGFENSKERIQSLPLFRKNSANMHKIRVNRVFYLRRGLLVVAASRKSDNMNCIFIQQMKALDFSTREYLVHDNVNKLWFNQDEDVLNFCELSSESDDEVLIGISTSQRVVIVSLGRNLRFLAQSFVSLRSTQIVPVGSGCVAYISESNPNEVRLKYLSLSDADLKEGVITSVPYSVSFIIGIRQDRVVLGFENTTYGEYDGDEYCVELRRPVIKPVLLLEQLVLSAVSSHENVTLLRKLCETFGIKTVPNPHGEQEGLGTIGVGVSIKLKKILGPMYDEIFPSYDDYIIPSNHKKTLLRDIANRIGYHKNHLRPWPKNFDESKHVWFRGPFDIKENILLLDCIEEWIGKVEPSIIGKAGLEAVEDNGDRALHHILAAARKANGSDDCDDDQVNHNTMNTSDGWIEGVGTGTNDEDNIVLYLRFSEGSEDQNWRQTGLKDLSNYNSKVTLVHIAGFDIRETSSNVDEGETGKVKPLNDLVVERDISLKEQFGLAVKVPRGSGLDVGMLHCSMNTNRQKATIEFWFRVPCAEFAQEVVLVRRSISEDIALSCAADQRASMIWELVLVPSGHLEFRSRAGSLLSSKSCDSITTNSTEELGKIMFPRSDGYGGWNHVSVGFTCQNMPATQCNVDITLKGTHVAKSTVQIIDADFSGEETLQIHLDELLKESALCFGLGAMKDFRMTEIRAWSCLRAIDDIRLNMFEYLDLARGRKKFRVAIKNKGIAKSAKTGLILPPRAVEKRKNALDSKLNSTESSHTRHKSDDESIHSEATFADFASIISTGDNFSQIGKEESKQIASVLEKHLLSYQSSLSAVDHGVDLNSHQGNKSIDGSKILLTEYNLLSDDIRRSATIALVRGPPATRHFGGNRGGLSRNHSGSIVAGSVCICGSEKTVIFSPTCSPSSRTYPIGASGAIISDKFQESEYLCCFIAKEKRVVVFDLVNKFVVVELQMTTKLNFWRYLPTPQLSNTLRFVLITPIGGFYWMPLEESPRPQQMWKRGEELASKKIISYEEGGSNGQEGIDFRSTIGLVLAVSDSILEAWVVSILEGLSPLCLSKNVVGACLLLDSHGSMERYDPIVCIVSNSLDESNMRICLHRLVRDTDELSIVLGECVADTFVDLINASNFAAPTMAMGDSPPVLCLSLYPYLVIVIRSQGRIIRYKYIDGSLVSDGNISVHRYVIDATMESNQFNGVTDIIALVHENNHDGRIVKISTHLGE